MTPEQFVINRLPYAMAVEKKHGLHHLISITQDALEGGWGERVLGNNPFGIKDTDGVNGNEILITTTEYLSTPNKKFPKVISVIKVTANKWKYKVQDYFRKYDSIEQAYTDHYRFFVQNPRYAIALKHKMDPDRFFEEIAKAGYATGANYAETLKKVKQSVIKRLPR